MAYEPVNVTQYRAKDGSLHKSPSAAKSHDEWQARTAVLDAVQTIVESCTWDDSELSKFCGYQHTHQARIYDENSYERGQRNRAIASIIVAKWPELSAAIARAEGTR